MNRGAALLLAAGILSIALYVVLRVLKVGRIGEPADIGGGFVLLLGCALLGLGLLAHRRGRG